MTYGTDSSTRVDDEHHPEHDAARDADDVRDEAYHATDETDTETDDENDTELDAAARRDATDTVDDDPAMRDRDTVDDETAMRDRDAVDDDTAMRDRDERDVYQAGEVSRERAFGADEADYEASHEAGHEAGHGAGYAHESNRVDGEPAGTPPTVVAVAPVNAVDEPAGDAADRYDAREAGTDRDAVEAVNAESASGTVYTTDPGTDTGTDMRPDTETGTEADTGVDEHRADNGPIVAEEAQDLKPGSVETTPVAAFWNPGDAEGIRERWRELQLRFIDDPETVTGEAERLVEEAVASLTASLNKAKQNLGNWRDGQGSDTERLRAAVRNYRDFLDRVLGL